MKSLTLITALLYSLSSFAGGDDDYAVSRISPALSKDVNVVVRKEEQRFELKSLDKAVETYKVVYTILNENADKYATIHVSYDRFTSIDYIDGNLYDANGKRLRGIKKGDIADRSQSSEFADDSRYKECGFYYKVYPYTVEFEYSVVRKQTMFLPVWSALNVQNCSVEESKFAVTVPAN